jgi:hypothetical protein
MQSKHPNRFFGLNPVGVPGNGRKDAEWNHDLPKTWRDAVEAAPSPTAATVEEIVDAEEMSGDADDA